ncbi:ribonuclease HII [Lysobacter oculi]|uniref:Ribonuclease HII n=1 Tax=Solilutibacter oculi TaxID=2698682 RepID=A0A344J5R0_9GAMM|nr:ribonuclease HII [Lysobacter oculi]AXA84370.1 ribonuclease HII [Lysobacter oculi]
MVHAVTRIAGIDEAGRGPLAGPLVVAAVVLPAGRAPINGLDDSKKLSAARREALAPRIRERALAYSVVVVPVEEIDRINIYQATLAGMRQALVDVAESCDIARIDGNVLPPDLPCPAEAWVGGDARCRAIMAASILAKTHRDALMRELHAQHPQYGFDRNMGYGSPAHMAALQAHGPCAVHRRSFSPIRQRDLFAAST